MTDITQFAEIAAADHNLCVVSTLRANGTIQSSVVNAGVLDDSPAGGPVVAFVSHGGTRKVSNLRAGRSSPSWRAPAFPGAGERRAERDPAAAAPYLEEAIRHGEAADTLTAAYARHTLLTTGARAADPESALPQFAVLISWLGLGAWGTLWLAIRALAETLSRCGRHGDAVRLLSAHEASTRAAPLIGADAGRRDAVLARARDALGGEFEAAAAEGRNLGDGRAIALARRLAC